MESVISTFFRCHSDKMLNDCVRSRTKQKRRRLSQKTVQHTDQRSTPTKRKPRLAELMREIDKGHIKYTNFNDYIDLISLLY